MAQTHTTNSGIERLFQHMWWADAAVLDSLTGATPLPRAIELYAHVLGAELTWIDRIEGLPQSTAVWPAPDTTDPAQLSDTARARYERLLAGLSESNLAKSIHYANSAGQTFDSRVDDILIHVALHGSYHRGQIALLLRDAGLEPRPTDYIAFVRGVPAATRQQ